MIPLTLRRQCALPFSRTRRCRASWPTRSRCGRSFSGSWSIRRKGSSRWRCSAVGGPRRRNMSGRRKKGAAVGSLTGGPRVQRIRRMQGSHRLYWLKMGRLMRGKSNLSNRKDIEWLLQEWLKTITSIKSTCSISKLYSNSNKRFLQLQTISILSR